MVYGGENWFMAAADGGPAYNICLWTGREGAECVQDVGGDGGGGCEGVGTGCVVSGLIRQD
jgi:hypothetical protein